MINRDCDFCKMMGKVTPAVVDSKTYEGPWAYMCEAHNKQHGCGVKGLTNVLADLPGVDDE